MEEHIFLGGGLSLYCWRCPVARQAEMPGMKDPRRLRAGNLKQGLLVRVIGLDTVPRRRTWESVLKCFAGCGFNLLWRPLSAGSGVEQGEHFWVRIPVSFSVRGGIQLCVCACVPVTAQSASHSGRFVYPG